MAQGGMAESRLLGGLSSMELEEGARPGQGPRASLRCWKEALSYTWLSIVPGCGGGGCWGATSQLRPALGSTRSLWEASTWLSEPLDVLGWKAWAVSWQPLQK